MQTPLQPAERLSVTLEAQQWNVIMAQLVEGPFRVVQPVIQALSEQLQAAQERLANPGSNIVPLPGQTQQQKPPEQEAS